jgi:hypothetical protein
MNTFLIDGLVTYLIFRFFIRRKKVAPQDPRIDALENQLEALAKEVEILKMELWVRK